LKHINKFQFEKKGEKNLALVNEYLIAATKCGDGQRSAILLQMEFDVLRLQQLYIDKSFFKHVVSETQRD
jgi:hypothetical protein